MPSARRKWALALALMALRLSAAHADDTLFGTVSGIRFPGDQYAYGGALTWQRARDRDGMLLGISDTQYATGSVGTADIDAYAAAAPGVFVSGGVSFGRSDGPSFANDLYKARLSGDWQLNPTWSSHISDQYIDWNVLRGHIVSGAVEYRPTGRLGISLGGSDAVGGTLADRYGQLILNWYGQSHVYGGLIDGRSGYDPANLGELEDIRHFTLAFAGAAIPMRIGSLTLGVESLRLGGANRETLRLGFIEPLRL